MTKKMQTTISPELKQALTLLAGGDVASALPGLERAAHQAVPEAMFTLGMLHANGEGVALDYARAAALIEGAAEQGLAAAESMLAWLYATGHGVRQSDEKARQWYLRAAENGSAESQFAVAVMYHFGRFGAQPDKQKMLYWYQRAAEQGYARACFALGKLMAEGERVERNDEAAFQWLTLAVMHGSEPAKRELAMLSARIKPSDLQRYKQRMVDAIRPAEPEG